MTSLLYLADKILEIVSAVLAYGFIVGLIPWLWWIAWGRRLYWLPSVVLIYFCIGGLIWLSEWLTVQVAGRNPYSYDGADLWFFWFWMLVGWYERLRSK